MEAKGVLDKAVTGLSCERQNILLAVCSRDLKVATVGRGPKMLPSLLLVRAYNCHVRTGVFIHWSDVKTKIDKLEAFQVVVKKHGLISS